MVNRKCAGKSASFSHFFVFLGLLLLASCADARWPSWITGEPDEEFIATSRVVKQPHGFYDPTFPNLALVPKSPATFSSTKERNLQIKRLSEDLSKAKIAKEKLEAVTVSQDPSSGWAGVDSAQETNEMDKNARQ